MTGVLKRYYVPASTTRDGSTDLATLCLACAARRRANAEYVQEAATPVLWEHPNLRCEDCGASCGCPACEPGEDAWLDQAFEERYELHD